MSRLQPNLNLHTVLKSSYKDPYDKSRQMEKSGYQIDRALSNGNQQIYYNSKQKKLLASVTGTHNLKDWGTDIYLALGKLKDTSRYKEADRILREAKIKYHPTSTTVTGHSLGGSIASSIASKSGGDKAITLDAGYTIGQKTRSNTDAYRSRNDLVSLFGANGKRMKTLDHGHLDTLEAHNIDNIKKDKIFV